MRTTIDIPDEVLARAKQAAAAQRRKLSDLVNDALLTALDRSAQVSQSGEPFQIRPFQLGSARSGVDFSDNGSVLDALDEESRDPSTGKFDVSKLR